MKIKQIDDSVLSFYFDELAPYQTIVYVIIREKNFYIIDTYCGSSYMNVIIDMLSPYIVGKHAVVINTHHHWDHIWGNECFKDAEIIAHCSCKELIKKTWNAQKQENAQYDIDDVAMILPTRIFQKYILLKEDELLFFHTPGHTEDSISIWDIRHHILFAGDNLEYPLIQLEQPDIDCYEKTLTTYLEMNVKEFYGGHTAHLKKDDIRRMRSYLVSLKLGEKQEFTDVFTQRIHEKNIEWMRKQE